MGKGTGIKVNYFLTQRVQFSKRQLHSVRLQKAQAHFLSRAQIIVSFTQQVPPQATAKKV